MPTLLLAAEGSVTVAATFLFAFAALAGVYVWLAVEMKRAGVSWVWFVGLAVGSLVTYGVGGVLVAIWWIVRSRRDRAVLRSGLIAFGVAFLLAGCAGLAGWVHNAELANSDLQERGQLNTPHDEQAGWGKIAAGAGGLLGIALIGIGVATKVDTSVVEGGGLRPGSTPPNGTNHCGQCGARWSAGAKFCTTCGAAG